ncbi:hypothetical protein BCR32DRAFT_277631 [Anaeromyces robustus]|uniref:Uncharacterized protein n=1 Tax=Anaeromyces robustus TaxID=1754192 RepID=A0A1Y1XDR1_9FUNG|nr:hypothetical protein BCR32DRAFT_277631 [Anaeromyces robustus]|eukprot:ORX83900.1 hypothetical protein BCR32DRAFT_277631 [Anaeromyces robustus]
MVYLSNKFISYIKFLEIISKKIHNIFRKLKDLLKYYTCALPCHSVKPVKEKTTCAWGRCGVDPEALCMLRKRLNNQDRNWSTSNISKTLELINTEANKDSGKTKILFIPNYIQYNLNYGTDDNAFDISVVYLGNDSSKTIFNSMKVEIKLFFKIIICSAGNIFCFHDKEYFDNGKYIQYNVGIADELDGLDSPLENLAEQDIKMIYNILYQILIQDNMLLSVSEGVFDSI